MNFLKKLRFGEFDLTTSFWIYFLLAHVVSYILLLGIGYTLVNELSMNARFCKSYEQLLFIIGSIINIIILLYFFIAGSGTIKSANKNKVNKVNKELDNAAIFFVIFIFCLDALYFSFWIKSFYPLIHSGC